MGWGLGFCISGKLPGDVDVARHTLGIDIYKAKTFTRQNSVKEPFDLALSLKNSEGSHSFGSSWYSGLLLFVSLPKDTDALLLL